MVKIASLRPVPVSLVARVLAWNDPNGVIATEVPAETRGSLPPAEVESLLAGYANAAGLSVEAFWLDVLSGYSNSRSTAPTFAEFLATARVVPDLRETCPDNYPAGAYDEPVPGAVFMESINAFLEYWPEDQVYAHAVVHLGSHITAPTLEGMAPDLYVWFLQNCCDDTPSSQRRQLIVDTLARDEAWGGPAPTDTVTLVVKDYLTDGPGHSDPVGIRVSPNGLQIRIAPRDEDTEWRATFDPPLQTDLSSLTWHCENHPAWEESRWVEGGNPGDDCAQYGFVGVDANGFARVAVNAWSGSPDCVSVAERTGDSWRVWQTGNGEAMATSHVYDLPAAKRAHATVHVRDAGWSTGRADEQAARKAAAVLKRVADLLLEQPLGAVVTLQHYSMWLSPRSAGDGYDMLLWSIGPIESDHELAVCLDIHGLVSADYFDESCAGDIDEFRHQVEAWLLSPSFHRHSAWSVMACARHYANEALDDEPETMLSP